MIHRAQYLITLQRPAEALKELDKDFDSENPEHWWLRGLALFGLNRLDAALDAAASGLRIDPESRLLLDLVARAQLARGELVKAEEAVLAALRADPEDADLLALYARIVAKAGQHEKAEKLIAQARRIEPENTSVLRVAATIAVSRGDEAEALIRSRELLALDPEDTHAHALTGGLLHDRGDVRGAAEHLRTAVVNSPSDPVAARIARENLVWRHPLMWPLRPVHKFGAAMVWVAGIALLIFVRQLGNRPLMTTVAVSWLLYCAYSWIVPPIVRKIIHR